MPRLTVTAMRLVGGPHDGRDVLVAGGALRIELPGDLAQVTKTGTYAGQRQAIYVRSSRRELAMTFEGWEGGSA